MGHTTRIVLVVVGLLAAAAVVVAGGLDSRRDRSSGVVANALANAERGSTYLSHVRTRPLDPTGEGSEHAWTTFGWSDEQGDAWLESDSPLAGAGAQVTVVGGQALLGVDLGNGARPDTIGVARWIDMGAGADVVGELLFGTPGLTFRLLAQAVAEVEEEGTGWVAGTAAARYRVAFEPVTISAAPPAGSDGATTGTGEPPRTVRVTGGLVWLDDRERLAAVELTVTPVDVRDEGLEELTTHRVGARDPALAGGDEPVVARPVVYVTPWEASVSAPPQPAATSTTAP